ncbi:FmdB family zinc ribbon protein [Paralcaligenes ureilyticus]|uniref:FmdB family zinc ribbon protein n=1 Tax=Paralcaligenes ureilyticus TaxID=627131 RepID=UPI00104E2606|nr:zinc ribbon domain-containing protein [Paralcaligenes ureilyticus]
MPIYAYKCSACGHEQDVLQKMSDPRLTVCPQCGQSTYVKQVTAAGFQLKGSGWYVTDFRGNGSKPDTGHTHSTNGHSSSSTGAHDGASASTPASTNGGASSNGSATNGSSSTSHTENKTAAPKTAAAPPASSSSAAAAPKH